MNPARRLFVLCEMSRSKVAAVLWLVVALHVTVAGLPHAHDEEAVRVGDLHLGHSGGTDVGSCVVPPLHLDAAATCLVCAVHAPQLAPPSGAAEPVVVPANHLRVDVRPEQSDPQRPWALPVRGPPRSA